MRVNGCLEICTINSSGSHIYLNLEAEDMARQKQELEQAKNIAAEIALEVERSRRELETCKTTFDKSLPEVYHTIYQSYTCLLLLY